MIESHDISADALDETFISLGDSAQPKAGFQTKTLAQIALCIAIMAVCAWVTIPLGAIPITLQMFALTFALVLLPPKAYIAAVAGYLVLGALGLPVFSGMRGGFGVLLGPTGGYLWGYLVGGTLATLTMQQLYKAAHVSLRDGVPLLKTSQDRKRSLGIAFVGSAIYIIVSYALAWAWFMVVAQVGPLASFASTVAPFILLDAAKVVIAAMSAQAVLRALPRK